MKLKYFAWVRERIGKDEEIIEETDIVLWCNAAVHHEPRHEDGMPNSAPRFWPGDDAWGYLE